MPGQSRERISKLFLPVRQKDAELLLKVLRRYQSYALRCDKQIESSIYWLETFIEALIRVLYFRRHMCAFHRRKKKYDRAGGYIFEPSKVADWNKIANLNKKVRFYFYVTRNSIALQAKGCAYTLVARNFISRNEETWSDSVHANARYKKVALQVKRI